MIIAAKNAETKALRASILHFLDDPATTDSHLAYEYFADGLLLLDAGHVISVGPYQELLPGLEGVKVQDYSGCLIMPGFIDCHIHYVQADIIASPAGELLDWLQRYTFPAERRFADYAYACEVADFFLQELFRNGTTSALVLGSVHKQSIDAVFTAARRYRMRLAAGKVMMDRNCPDDFQDSVQSGYADVRALIETWHKKDRFLYAVTPRFAPTSTSAQLKLAGRLLDEYDDVFMHTHVAENREEVKWVAALFPHSRSYLDVYDAFGLLRERSVLAHCIYLDAADRRRMAACGAAAAFCPTSNLFLGSGLFDMQAADDAGMRVGMATDVGGGSSFGMLQTLHEAYKVMRMSGQSLSSLRAFYLATLGGARALYIDQHVGNFAAGKEADFIIIEPAATPLLERRMNMVEHLPEHLEEKLFVLMMLGDDRVIRETHLLGERVHG